MIVRALLILVSLAFAACGSSRVKPDKSTQIVKEGVAAIWVAWVKDKGDKYDVNMNIHNDSTEKGMIIFLSDMTCKRGSMPGKLRHTFFNTGERTIDFRPRETKSFNLVCDTHNDQKGDFTIHFAKIYDNPSLDGKTTGKVIAENLEWRQPDKR